MADLTPQQERFVAEFLVDLNATQAAMRAGYSKSTAKQQGSRLLTNAAVQEAIAAGKAARSDRLQMTADDVLRHLFEIATADVNDLVQFRIGACPSCWGEADAEQGKEELEPQPHGGALKRSRAAARGMGEPGRDPNPDCVACGGEGLGRVYVPDTRTLRGPARRLYAGVKVTKDGLQVMMRSQDKALELIADHLGMLRNVKVSGPNGGPIETHELTKTMAALPREKRDLLRAAIQKVLEGGAHG